MSDSKKFYSFYPENNILLLNNHFWTSWYPQDERKTSKHLYLTSKRLQESSEMCRNIIDKVVRFSGIGQSSAETLLCSLSVFADMFALFFFYFFVVCVRVFVHIRKEVKCLFDRKWMSVYVSVIFAEDSSDSSDQV